ncbi:MAG: D-glycerate dehydrogenase [Pseudomonadota bacterium]
MSAARPRVALTRLLPEPVLGTLRERYEVRLPADGKAMRTEAIRDACYWADALCPTVTDALDATFFQTLDRSRLRTRLLANFGVGFNHIDLPAAANLGISVSNTPGVLTDATADLTMALILMCARRAGEGERALRAGQWRGWQPTALMGRDVTGARLGIVGMGRIGQAVAVRARFGFSMSVRYFSRTPLPAPRAQALGAVSVDSLQQLIENSDFVSLHCPSTAQTRHLINAQTLGYFAPDSYLINTARGDIVDEAALAQALQDGRLAGAGLDVYEHEPQVHPGLGESSRAVLLPHLGSATIQTRRAMAGLVARNLQAFFDGQPLPNPVAA